MTDFFKYLQPEEEDVRWGLYLTVAGRSKISPHTSYPLSGHPEDYYFTSNNGRILHEYQINYITEGEGNYEDNSGKYKIEPGSLIIIKPEHWHKYNPSEEKGWVENYIGFNGEIAKIAVNNFLQYCDAPVYHVGIKETVIDTYDRIFHRALDSSPGHQQVIAGMIMKLLGDIVSAQKQEENQGDRMTSTMNKICFYLRENVEKPISFQSVASEHNLGYYHFRKVFKEFTGVPPAQYLLNLKINRAKEMLLSTDKTVKEISYELGFKTVYYFCRIFKTKTGYTPSEIRSLNERKNTVRREKL